MRLLALAAPLVLAALSPAQTVLLRFKPPIGKTVNYVTTMAMSGASMPNGMTQTMTMTYRVVSRTANTTTVQTKVGEIKNSMGTGRNAASGMSSTTVIDEFGNLTGMNVAGGAAAGLGAGMMAGAQGVSFPKKALKVGDGWTTSLDLGKMLSKGGAGASGLKVGGKPIPIAYRLVGIEKRGGTTLAKVSLRMKGGTTMSMNMGASGGKGQGMTMSMQMDSKGTLLIDAATGLVQSMTNVSDTTTQVMGQNVKQHMVMTMKAS